MQAKHQGSPRSLSLPDEPGMGADGVAVGTCRVASSGKAEISPFRQHPFSLGSAIAYLSLSGMSMYSWMYVPPGEPLGDRSLNGHGPSS